MTLFGNQLQRAASSSNTTIPNLRQGANCAGGKLQSCQKRGTTAKGNAASQTRHHQEVQKNIHGDYIEFTRVLQSFVATEHPPHTAGQQWFAGLFRKDMLHISVVIFPTECQRAKVSPILVLLFLGVVPSARGDSFCGKLQVPRACPGHCWRHGASRPYRSGHCGSHICQGPPPLPHPITPSPHGAGGERCRRVTPWLRVPPRAHQRCFPCPQGAAVGLWRLGPSAWVPLSLGNGHSAWEGQGSF